MRNELTACKFLSERKASNRPCTARIRYLRLQYTSRHLELSAFASYDL